MQALRAAKNSPIKYDIFHKFFYERYGVGYRRILGRSTVLSGFLTIKYSPVTGTTLFKSRTSEKYHSLLVNS